MEGIGSELHERINRKGIIISRIPEFAKEAFIERAKLEFEDDYGMCLAAMVKESSEYNLLKSKFFNNDLNLQLSIGSPIEQIDSQEYDEIKMGNGKIIKKRRSS